MALSRMCWCDDLACRFQSIAEFEKGYRCPSVQPANRDGDGYDAKALESADKWAGRLFTCPPLTRFPEGG
jgi:hypothetical protein